MSIFFEEDDIDSMLEDTGVDVQVSGSSVRALIDMPDEALLQNGSANVAGRMISALFKTSDVEDIAPGDALTIDGVSYTVRERLRRDEGAMTRVLCAKA